MANQQGIAITIKAFLPTGKTLDEQFAALSTVKTAHETGDYSDVLKAARIEEVKAEQKTRRVEEQPEGQSQEGDQSQQQSGDQSEREKGDEGTSTGNTAPLADADVPGFLKGDKKSKAA